MIKQILYPSDMKEKNLKPILFDYNYKVANFHCVILGKRLSKRAFSVVRDSCNVRLRK